MLDMVCCSRMPPQTSVLPGGALPAVPTIWDRTTVHVFRLGDRGWGRVTGFSPPPATSHDAIISAKQTMLITISVRPLGNRWWWSGCGATRCHCASWIHLQEAVSRSESQWETGVTQWGEQWRFSRCRWAGRDRVVKQMYFAMQCSKQRKTFEKLCVMKCVFSNLGMWSRIWQWMRCCRGSGDDTENLVGE